jgi:Winged helix-turn helix
MIYARQPREEEDAQLRAMIRRETGRISQRARMILLSTQHRSTSELAEIFTTDKVTVRRWIHRFNMLGPAGLYDVPRPGRPRKQAHPQGGEHQALPRPMPAITSWLPAMEITSEGGPNGVVPEDVMAHIEERTPT